MVPFAVFLALLGAAAAGQSGNAHDMAEMMKMKEMMDMMKMKDMMDQMEQAKGWGGWGSHDEGNMGGNNGGDMGGNNGGNNGGYNGGNNGGGAPAPVVTAAPAPGASEEEIAAYMKWCEENQVRVADQKRQEELLATFERKEAARKAEIKAVADKRDADERRMVVEAESKMLEKQMSMTSAFENLGYKVQEMKHSYYYLITFEFLKFCKCSDFTNDLGRYLNHDGIATSHHEEYDLTDLDGCACTDADDVAQRLFSMDQATRTKAFFGSMAIAMCEGARNYLEQVVAWDNQYNFLERLH